MTKIGIGLAIVAGIGLGYVLIVDFCRDEPHLFLWWLICGYPWQ